MLSLGKFPTPIHYLTLLQNPVAQNLQFPPKSHISFSSHLNIHAVLVKMRGGMCCNAFKTKKNGGFSLKEMDGSDEFEEGFDDELLDIEFDGVIEGEDDDDDEEEEEDEVFIPLRNMKQWLENKPRGFGEGKVYDTSIEDELMEEIEQSRKAQLANLNQLKNNPVRTGGSMKETVKKDKGPTLSQDGFRVRLVNLPKKKNIHRDLRLAFQGVPGIVNIVPVVSGNEKTRDPVCKGLAFVDFKNKDEAQRFIQNFSGQSISFGKVQKQIKCEMMEPRPACDQSDDESNCAPQETMLNLDEDLDTGIETDVSLLDSSEESFLSELDDADERHASGQWEEEEEDDGEFNETSTTSDFDLAEELELGEESAKSSSPSNQTRKSKMNEKKAASKRSKNKLPKLNIPGSANKLKIREKEVLTGVLSKYGANATSTAKQQSR